MKEYLVVHEDFKQKLQVIRDRLGHELKLMSENGRFEMSIKDAGEWEITITTPKAVVVMPLVEFANLYILANALHRLAPSLMGDVTYYEVTKLFDTTHRKIGG